jgi:hypothetical protein
MVSKIAFVKLNGKIKKQYFYYKNKIAEYVS